MVWRALWLLRQGVTGSVWRARYFAVLVLGFGLISGVARAQEPQPDLPPPDATGPQSADALEPRPDVPTASKTSGSPQRKAQPAAERPSAAANPASSGAEADSSANGKNPKPNQEGPSRAETPAPEAAVLDLKPVRSPGARERVVRLSSPSRLEETPEVTPIPRMSQPLGEVVSGVRPGVEDGATKLVLGLGALALAVLVASSTAFLFNVARRNRNELRQAR